MGEQPHVVIVGGGFGGLRAARALRKAPVGVTLIDAQNHHLFQPLLYQVATAGLSPADIAMPIRAVLRDQQNADVVLGEVVRADLDARAVELADGSRVSYDYLVVAAGATTNFFGHDEWAEHAATLKHIPSALHLRERILLAFEAAEREPDPERRRELLTFIVIGGGPTGVELAGAISELGRLVMARDFRRIRPEEVRVLLLEMMDRLLGPFDPELSRRSQQMLEGLGVEVRLGSKVTEVRKDGARIGDTFLPASTVCWTTGVKPVELGSHLGVETNKRGSVPVEQDCSVPGHPEVFAIGDIASFVPEGEEQPLPGLASVAMQQGAWVAKAIRRDLGKVPRGRFVYRDKGIMATVGRSRAVAQTGAVKLAGLLAWLMWTFVHIFYLIGFRNRVAVIFNWFWAYMTFKRGARLITGRYATPELPTFPERPSDRPDEPIATGTRDDAPPYAHPPT